MSAADKKTSSDGDFYDALGEVGFWSLFNMS